MIRTSLASALMLLSGAAFAQAPRAATPAAPQRPELALIGTPAGEARRKALLSAIEDWKTFLPEDAKDPLTAKYQPPLHAIREAARGLKAGEQIEPVEKNFADWKQTFLRELFEANKGAFFGDEERFTEFTQKRLDALTMIRDQKRGAAPRQLKRLDQLKSQLGGAPDQAALDRVFDKLNGSKKAAPQAEARAVKFSRSQPTASSWFYSFIAPKARAYAPQIQNYSPEKVSPPPTPVSLADASYHGSASSWSLSKVIETVSSTARRYAGKVADAIVNFSRKLNLDERLQAAIVWAESNFNPHAKSGAGAMGLGQLMPGTAAGLGVHNAYDIDQNLRGSTVFTKNLIDHFSSPDEMKYTQGLYAWGATRVRAGQPAAQVWQEVFEKTPLGVKNAIAAYNAGQGAIDYYAHGDYRQLPVRHTRAAERNGTGYWQTIHYVPSVLRHYFDIMIQTPAKPPMTFSTPSSMSA